MTGNEDFASLFGEFEKKQGMTSKKEPRTGDKVIGTVVSIQSDNIFIDLGSTIRPTPVQSWNPRQGSPATPGRFQTALHRWLRCSVSMDIAQVHLVSGTKPPPGKRVYQVPLIAGPPIRVLTNSTVSSAARRISGTR